MQVRQPSPGRGEGDEVLARGHDRHTRQGLLEVRGVATAVLRMMQEAVDVIEDVRLIDLGPVGGTVGEQSGVGDVVDAPVVADDLAFGFDGGRGCGRPKAVEVEAVIPGGVPTGDLLPRPAGEELARIQQVQIRYRVNNQSAEIMV